MKTFLLPLYACWAWGGVVEAFTPHRKMPTARTNSRSCLNHQTPCRLANHDEDHVEVRLLPLPPDGEVHAVDGQLVDPLVDLAGGGLIPDDQLAGAGLPPAEGEDQVVGLARTPEKAKDLGIEYNTEDTGSLNYINCMEGEAF